MCRLAVISCVALTAVGTGTASAASPAIVKLAQCRVSTKAHGRSATFVGRMRSVPNTNRMAMRFTLLERLGRGAAGPLEVPGLAAWRISRHGVRRFRYRQQVRGLLKGGTYRALVEFRWQDAAGHRIKAKARRSAPCRQPGRPPNLQIASVEVVPGTVPSVAAYQVVVANTGGSAQRGVRLSLAVDGELLGPVEIASLRPGERRRVEVLGPVCRREVEAAVDPDQDIRESNEADNVRVQACSTASGRTRISRRAAASRRTATSHRTRPSRRPRPPSVADAFRAGMRSSSP
jgi:CARDB